MAGESPKFTCLPASRANAPRCGKRPSLVDGSGGHVRQLGIGHWACALLRKQPSLVGGRSGLKAQSNRRMIGFTPCKGKRMTNFHPFIISKQEAHRSDPRWEATVWAENLRLEGVSALSSPTEIKTLFDMLGMAINTYICPVVTIH